MKLINFNFRRITIEKFEESLDKLKINTKIEIDGIEKIEENPFLEENTDLVRIKFTYIIDYNPNIAKIELSGNIILSIDNKISKGIIEGWAEKKISEDFRILIFNLILKKANIKALELEDQMNLPTHVPMPTLKKPVKKE
ncbi:MAG TPA: hypothetical protein VJ438_04850 [Candidatus Nanoarchaeia archaeon]|nr:hypothetical protein [Candidatus Nanoarchaeia archaeon]